MDFFQLIIFGILFNAAIMLISKSFRHYTIGIDSLPTISIIAGYTLGAAAGLWVGTIVAIVYHLMRIRTIQYMPLTILANAVVGILASLMAFGSIFTAGIALLIVYHIISIAAVSVFGRPEAWLLFFHNIELYHDHIPSVRRWYANLIKVKKNPTQLLSMSEIVIIAGVSENNVIGASGKLPWHISEDLKHFRELTLGHSVVMGRKTFESLGKPLPGRLNIVITNQTDYKPDGVLIANSLEQALKTCKNHKFTFIIGGQSVYEQALPLADRLEITRIHRKVDGDAFFPKIDIIDWEEVMREDHKEYSFVTYMRRG